MSTPVASLIQIHYHDRPGGVREVMRLYAEAFSGINKEKNTSIILGNISGPCYYPEYVKVQCIRECDYEQFTDSHQFEKQRNTIISKIEHILQTVPRPVAVVCHNVNLGKNPALSSAISDIARRLASGEVRFFWVIHDFAEEGRTEQLDNIRRIGTFYKNIWNDLYAAGAPVHYIVPGANAFAVLKSAQFPVTELVNPFKFEMPEVTQETFSGIAQQLETGVVRDSGVWYSGKRTGYYSSRMIYRKNYLEAIALVCIILEENLITGLAGNSTGDKIRLERYKDFVRKFKLPVFFDASRLCRYNDSAGESPAPLLYKFADYGVSTSVAEGFGYSLFEPWLYGRSLTGRIPEGFLYPDGINTSSLYNRFPVPVEWVDLNSIIENYSKRIMYYIGEELTTNQVQEKILFDGTIDFGILPEQIQYSLLVRLLENRKSKQKLKMLLETRMPGWPGLDAFTKVNEHIVDQNRDIFNVLLSKKNFNEQFYRCIVNKIPEPAGRINIPEVSERLLGRSFRLLLMPSEM